MVRFLKEKCLIARLSLIFIIAFQTFCFILVPVNAKSLSLDIISHTDTGGDAYDLWVDPQNHLAYVSCGYIGLKIFNISNPQFPLLLGSLPSASAQGHTEYAHQLLKDGDLLYVGDGFGGLKIINVSIPSSPSVVFQRNQDYAWAVRINESLQTAYVSNGFTGIPGQLTIFNISNPFVPTLISSLSIPYHSWDLELLGDLLFMTALELGVIVVNISNSSLPFEIGQYSNPNANEGYATEISLVENCAFLSYSGAPLELINITDPTDVVSILSFSDLADVYSTTIQNNCLYVCDLNKGLRIYDITNIIQPRELFRYENDFHPNFIRICDDLIYLTEQTLGLVIMQIGTANNNILGYSSFLLIGVIIAYGSFGIGFSLIWKRHQ